MLNKFTLICSLFISISCHGQESRKLIWSDEFNKSGLPDAGKWNYEIGLVRNNEAQFYTKENLKNARIENGMLIIEAIEEDYQNAQYTSASLITKGKKSFRYGRFEVRAKLPVGKGTWPAIWLLGENINEVGWPECGEIDIMENVGFDSLRIHGNIHTKAYNHVMKTNKGNNILVSKPWEDFHVYAVDWRADKIDFFVDDKLYFTFKKESASNDVWPFDNPHYLILNLAIGGGWGGQQGIDNSKFPHKFYIDYVRVYE